MAFTISGVMEHFSPQEIIEILKQFNNVLIPGGKVVLLWPPVYGLSVIALHWGSISF